MRLPNLIFEGCDCVGKTSTINDILQRFPQYQRIHVTAPKSKEEAKAEYEREVEQLKMCDNLIYDRLMLGECVYAPIFRGYYPEYMRDLEEQVHDNAFLIVLTADPEVIKTRFDGKFIKSEQIKEIVDAYKHEFAESKYQHKLMIDTTNKYPEEVAEEVMYFVFQNMSVDQFSRFYNGER